MTRLPAKVKHYRILSELAPGSGSYLADDESLKRQVVLKQLRPDALSTPSTLQAFRDTVKKLARNPSVPVARTVELLQLRADEGLLRFLVREFREGLSLEASLLRRGELPAVEVAGWIAAVAGAIDAMHQAETVHGNLTASNVIVDGAGILQLTDYAMPSGAASRSYQAPEIVEGYSPTPASDLYSIGAIWCRLLSGQFPGTSGAPQTALDNAGEHSALIARLLDANPSTRLASGAELARALQSSPGPESAPRPRLRMESPAARASAGRTARPLESTGGVATSPRPRVDAPTPPVAMVPRSAHPTPRPPVTVRETLATPVVSYTPDTLEDLADRPQENTRPAIGTPGEGIDWDRVLRHIAKSPPEAVPSPDARRAKRVTVDIPQILPQRSSEAPSPRANSTSLGQLLHRAVTAAQFLFVFVALAFLLKAVGQETLAPGFSSPLARASSSPAAPARSHALAMASDSRSAAPGGAETNRDLSMCVVPGGTFQFQNPFTNQRETVAVPPFEIDRYEVSNAQYLEFTRQAGYVAEGNWQRYFLPGHERQPVVGISWKDARAYAQWAGKRLPTAQEWQLACGGKEAKPFPWGGGFDPAKVVGSQLSKLAPVDAMPDGKAECGAHHMAGNAWEWVADTTGGRHVAMGGSFQSDPFALGTLARMVVPAEGFRTPADYGFRCAR